MQIVNGLKEARAALEAGGRALQSPAYAACHAGVGYYAALVNALSEDYPDMEFLLCCGDDPAVAHEAMRHGFRAVRCRCEPSAYARLEAIAQGQGARLQRD